MIRERRLLHDRVTGQGVTYPCSSPHRLRSVLYMAGLT